ncbi:MAG TPA: cysteine peptidase family C39 domain-containing protein [Candidatus Pacearchaeota archaeon]|nr:cysteine peptidase family C39 domain-containing protein [Candidatus Pacearchaeota archaeon]
MKRIKILKQETNKSCGIACLRSIINYYGNNYSEKDIWKKNQSFGKGEELRNPILSLGVTALKFGLDVQYLGYNPIILNNNKHPDNLKKSLELKSKSYFGFGKYYVNQALQFLKLGGKIVSDNLNVKKLKKIIDKEKFFLVEVKPAFISKRSSAGINMNHKVIVVGYTNKGFKVLNPSDGQEYVWDFDSFLIAFYAAVPEILVINKKKK